MIICFNQKTELTHSTSIPAAIKAIERMPLDNPDYVGLNLNHGKDRCAGPPREFRHFSKYVSSSSAIDEC